MNNDLISREVLKKQILPLISYEERIYIESIIDNAPTAGSLYTITSNTFVEGASMRPQGEWIEDKFGDHFCSNCKTSAFYNEAGLEAETRFCPSCGADMRKGEEV